MGWLDSILGSSSGGSGVTDLFSGGSGNFGDGSGGWFNNWGLGDSNDWSGDALNWAFGGGDNSFDFDWGDLAGTSGGSSGGGGGWASTIGNMLGGGGEQGGQGNMGNIWGSLLAGLGGAADSYLGGKMDEKAMREKGKQDRLTIGYGADIQDYYKQLDKQRKRIALDTYGQFSLLDRNIAAAPGVQVPGKPTPGG